MLHASECCERAHCVGEIFSIDLLPWQNNSIPATYVNIVQFTSLVMKYHCVAFQKMKVCEWMSNSR